MRFFHTPNNDVDHLQFANLLLASDRGPTAPSPLPHIPNHYLTLVDNADLLVRSLHRAAQVEDSDTVHGFARQIGQEIVLLRRRGVEHIEIHAYPPREGELLRFTLVGKGKSSSRVRCWLKEGQHTIRTEWSSRYAAD